MSDIQTDESEMMQIPEEGVPSIDTSHVDAPSDDAASGIENPVGTDGTEVEPDDTPPMRILKIGTCGSLSSRSTLIYHFGVDGARNALHLRLFGNSAKGYFSKDWIPMALVELLLAGSFSSSDVQRMFFEGKSANSGGFVLAALRNEGLIRSIPGALRHYEGLDPTEWRAEMQQLIEDGVALSEQQKPATSVAVIPVVGKGRNQATQRGSAPRESTLRGAKAGKQKAA